MNGDDILRAQLFAIRAQLDAAHATIDACLLMLEPSPQPHATPSEPHASTETQAEKCARGEHPEDMIRDASNLMEQNKWKCLACGAEFVR